MDLRKCDALLQLALSDTARGSFTVFVERKTADPKVTTGTYTRREIEQLAADTDVLAIRLSHELDLC